MTSTFPHLSPFLYLLSFHTLMDAWPPLEGYVRERTREQAACANRHVRRSRYDLRSDQDQTTLHLNSAGWGTDLESALKCSYHVWGPTPWLITNPALKRTSLRDKEVVWAVKKEKLQSNERVLSFIKISDCSQDELIFDYCNPFTTMFHLEWRLNKLVIKSLS